MSDGRMSDAVRRALRRADVDREIGVWLQAVDLQCRRAVDYAGRGTVVASTADAYLFALALRNLIRAVEWARREYGVAVAALAAFDATVPDAVNVRDVIEHFDDYARASGDLQPARARQRKRTPRLADDFAAFFALDGQTVRMHVGDMVLDVAAANEAAHALAAAAVDELARANG